MERFTLILFPCLPRYYQFLYCRTQLDGGSESLEQEDNFSQRQAEWDGEEGEEGHPQQRHLAVMESPCGQWAGVFRCQDTPKSGTALS